jgi:aminomethyltransferase
MRDNHVALGAKMVDFAGYEMPVQYESIIAEHNHTRTQASLFDISHMGEFTLRGDGAMAALEKIVTHNLRTLAPGKCRYGFLLNERGGVLDDLIVYCLGQDDYMLVVNAACEKKDFDWIDGHLPAGLDLVNISEETAKIDLQGPLALQVLESVFEPGWRRLGYFNFEQARFDGRSCLVSRTGYTGELGYELYIDTDRAAKLWDELLHDEHCKPAGLGARDTLRLEMGYPLYGQDIDEEHTPVEAGYEWMLSSEADFIGKSGLGAPREFLIPLKFDCRRCARCGATIVDDAGNEIGRITSGSFSPSLGHSIALAYIVKEHADKKRFKVVAGKAELEAMKTDLPFYKDGTARKKL